mmetsp:Transcript_17132/g.47802  ORF Transcript_17132/g.47802 Transcript_17132/m.47802 type:complete len:218 (-) Transcript_17132:1035-1688(-)
MRLLGKGRVQRQAGHQGLPGCSCGSRQLWQHGPGLLRVDPVAGDWRNAAPVVDAGVQQGPPGGAAAWCQVWRRLDIHRGPKNNPGDRHSPQELFLRRLGMVCHRGAWLGTEVLDDYLLYVTILPVQLAKSKQGIQALLPGLSDADEQATGEGHGGLPGSLYGGQPHSRVLVRAIVMREPLLHQPGRGTLQHQSLAGRDPPQISNILAAHHSRVDVRQ